MGSNGSMIVFGKFWKDKKNEGKYCYSPNPYAINYKLVPKIKSGLDLLVKMIEKNEKEK